MADSTFKQALDAVKTALEALDLDGIGQSNGRIKVRRFPHDGEHYFPGITVHPSKEEYDVGTNNREDVGYGCQLTMVQNNDNDDDLYLNRVLQWRETIRKTFVEDPTIGTIPDDFRVMVEMGPVFVWDDFAKENYDVSIMTLRVWCRESRS